MTKRNVRLVEHANTDAERVHNQIRQLDGLTKLLWAYEGDSVEPDVLANVGWLMSDLVESIKDRLPDEWEPRRKEG